MVEANESKLVEEVAESISEGVRVDWEDIERQPADEDDTGVLRELHVVEKIAAFYRSPDVPSSGPTDPSERRETDEPSGTTVPPEPRTWGHLTILEQIGEGTFATVYRARDDRLQADVALKLVKPGGPSNPSKALDEARLLARTRHPNVVTVYGADLIDGRVGVWMEFVKGRTLADLLRTRGPLSAGEASLVGLDLCRALAAVHAAGLVHGDVKAHNVMREEGGRIVLMDFGTGKDLNKGPTHNRGSIDDFAGTPLYLPPEVFEGQDRTKLTDIYSLGVLLYHLVTDAYPVEGRTRDEVEQAHRRHERKRLRDLRPDLPDEFIQTVERASSSDVAERYQSAGAFEAALQGKWVEPRPTPNFRWTMVLVASAIAAAIVGGVIYRDLTRGPQPVGGSVVTPTTAAVRENASSSVSAVSTGTYQIEPAFYRERDGEPEIRLRSGARVAPGDNIFVKLRASAPTYVYIVNEDEHGKAYLEFPLPGQSVTNPLAPGKTHRLPGRVGNREYSWLVDTTGGREHFIVFASPQPLGDFEQTVFAALPHPEVGKAVMNAVLSDAAAGALRSVGGLAVKADSRPQKTGPLIQLFPKPLGDTEETAEGLWVRQLTLENPSK